VNEENRWIKDVLWFFVFVGLLSIVFRLWSGLGATTNLSDAAPWGLWKILNMVAGVALSTGGFTVGFLVYGLKLERFRPLVKPAILIAFLGYGSSVFALTLDIGLPHRIWHPLVMWNEHSFLFEVAWCVMLYFTVTIIELSPTFLERMGLARLAGFLHRIAFGVVVTGIALSSLHHSSLGSLFLVTPQRLHPLWYTSLLPIHFILSAMGAGIMVVVLARILFARWFEHRPIAAGDRTFPMLQSLASIGAAVLTGYLAIRIVDLMASGAWRHLVAGTWESWLYAIELLASAVIPVAFVAIPSTRRSPPALAFASTSAAFGLVLNRLDVGIFGYFSDAKTAYLPSLNEWALSLGVLAAAGLVFFHVVENYAIFDDDWKRRRIARREFMPNFDRASRVWLRALGGELNRASLAAVFAIPVAWVLLYPAASSTDRLTPSPATAPIALDAERAVLRIDGNRGGMATVFPHREHQDRLGRKDSCVHCHHLSLPGDHSTPCSRCHRDMERASFLFRHEAHFSAVAASEGLTGWIRSNHSCGECHEPADARGPDTAKPCLDCHRKDMAPTRDIVAPLGMAHAAGYREAMHGTCRACHQKERDRAERPDLAECATCHQSLRSLSPMTVAARPTEFAVTDILRR
jgi:Ni/Fe-hydrogenase subunit HybB-like protein